MSNARGAVLALVLVLTGVAACASPPPPAPVAPVEPLVIGKSPPGASMPASADKPAQPASDDSGRFPRGNTPAIWLDSLTTPGKATMPAGKVVLVHFWATWCAPCQKSFPAFQALYAKYKSRGLEIVAVSVDDEKAGIVDFARQYGVRFPVAWDDGHKLAEAWKVMSMPSTMLVDKDGTLSATHSGWHDGEEHELEKELAGLL